jgi:hypothetical protein
MSITKVAMQHPGATHRFFGTVLRRKLHHIVAFQKPDEIIKTVPMSLTQQVSDAKSSTHPSQTPKSSKSPTSDSQMQAT